MNLTEIIVSALDRLGRGTDNQTVDHYRTAFTEYANTAVELIARRYQPIKKDTVPVVDGVFSSDDLSNEPLKIVKVLVNGSETDYEQDLDGSGDFTIGTNAEEAVVYYRYLPKKLSNAIDIPELPKHMHDYIKYYIVASERCGGDPYTQGTSSADFQMFNQFVGSLESCKLGQASAYALKNY